MSQTITVSNEVYAAIVARRLHKDETEDTILSRILLTAGDAEAVHAHANQDPGDAKLILDSDMDHVAE
ncbi:hypothetical protein [Marinobacterium weihaiense]|uniref:Addiction module antidote protein n=1 Tax=Marinobacterium weihaiense TaxID=2851016 RepID=A0ABS6MFL1_9GAMM|nr:hypothetical protein [Marinobacterium weihaiense]MBV0934654.1 hypothetical protein [Marinobacterium weihaiense]